MGIGCDFDCQAACDGCYGCSGCGGACSSGCTSCDGCTGCQSCSGCSGCTNSCSGCCGCSSSCCGGCDGCSGCGSACSSNCTGCSGSCSGTCTNACDGCQGCQSCVGSCTGDCNNACSTANAATDIANIGSGIVTGQIIYNGDLSALKSAIEAELIRRSRSSYITAMSIGTPPRASEANKIFSDYNDIGVGGVGSSVSAGQTKAAGSFSAVISGIKSRKLENLK